MDEFYEVITGIIERQRTGPRHGRESVLRAAWLREAVAGSPFPRRAALARRMLLRSFDPAGKAN